MQGCESELISTCCDAKELNITGLGDGRKGLKLQQIKVICEAQLATLGSVDTSDDSGSDSDEELSIVYENTTKSLNQRDEVKEERIDGEDGEEEAEGKGEPPDIVEPISTVDSSNLARSNKRPAPSLSESQLPARKKPDTDG